MLPGCLAFLFCRSEAIQSPFLEGRVGKVFNRQLAQMQINLGTEKRQKVSKSMLQVRLELTTSALLNRYCHIGTAR